MYTYLHVYKDCNSLCNIILADILGHRLVPLLKHLHFHVWYPFLHPQPCIRNATELCVFSMFSVESHSCELFRRVLSSQAIQLVIVSVCLSEPVSNNELPRYYVASVTLMHLSYIGGSLSSNVILSQIWILIPSYHCL